MRIISGEFKGKQLKSPISDNIRPTGDKVKQAIFTKLQFFVPQKVVLDLFSGSGALGIEAISRGARLVYFVDKDNRNEFFKSIEGRYKTHTAQKILSRINIAKNAFLNNVEK